MKKLVEEASQSLNKKLEEVTKNTIAKVVALTLNDGIETYTLYVTPSDYDLANKGKMFFSIYNNCKNLQYTSVINLFEDITHAQNLLDQHKKAMIEQLNNTAATNFVQDDLTSVASGSNVMFLDIYEDVTNQTYRLTVTPEAHERALLGK